MILLQVKGGLKKINSFVVTKTSITRLPSMKDLVMVSSAHWHCTFNTYSIPGHRTELFVSQNSLIQRSIWGIQLGGDLFFVFLSYLLFKSAVFLFIFFIHKLQRCDCSFCKVSCWIVSYSRHTTPQTPR